MTRGHGGNVRGGAHSRGAAARRGPAADEIAREPDEIWGWLLLVVGALAVLAVHFNLLGRAGIYVRRDGAAVLGWGLDVLPLSFLVVGWTLVSGRARRGAPGALVALVVLALSSAGLGDLAGGHPAASATARILGGAGGFTGAAIGGGLRDVIGTAGAGIVLGAIAFVAACACCARSVRQGVLGVGHALGAARRAAARFSTDRPSEEPETVAETAPATEPALIDWALNADDAIEADPTSGLGSLVAQTRAGRRNGQRGGNHALVDEGSVATAPHGISPLPAADFLPPSTVVEQLGLGVVPAPSNWKLPPERLLRRSKELGTDRQGVEERGKLLEGALSSHGVATRVTGFTVGPTVTRFELELAPGVKVAQVTSLSKDIAYVMASPDVRILAPIPGRSAIGVEVPNHDRRLVTLGDVLSTPEAHRALHPLEVGLGRDIAGRPVMVNLAEMPHLLIAGATGSGKSSCINSVVTSILMRSTPEQVRLILVDPKRVELGHYNGLPHLLTEVVVNPKRAANALAWTVTEMERRYDLLAEVGMRDITGYNAAVDRGDLAEGPFDGPIVPHDAAVDDAEISDGLERTRYQRLPFVLLVVDELNDLMMVAARDVEESICRIAQMARAVGIHLVIATQRPSVDVITGVIKANIPSRLAFSVSSLADSRVILDQSGAERLIGRGDLLLLTASSSIPRRIQGPWVSEEEVHSVVAHWRRQSDPLYVAGIVGDEDDRSNGGLFGEDDDDELLRQAMDLVVRSQLGSTSMLQRKLRVGFARAGRLMDLLERRGIVGPSEGSKARTVLLTLDEYEEIPR
ncbi:MAG TPA: DNA translocase FtsK [Acidimicrobiales bacterium]|nr:DNA translocase FtsK [Acidimicrobiales bacterium]